MACLYAVCVVVYRVVGLIAAANNNSNNKKKQKKFLLYFFTTTVINVMHDERWMIMIVLRKK